MKTFLKVGDKVIATDKDGTPQGEGEIVEILDTWAGVTYKVKIETVKVYSLARKNLTKISRTKT